MLICGLDEAGRGPVLGPLVMAALVFDEEGEKKLKWLGVKDSKLLSSQVREELFDRIRELVLDFRIEVIEPDAIDLSVSGEVSNLNWLEADTSARMVSELRPDKVIVDCPSVNPISYREYFVSRLSEGVKNNIDLILEHKADLNHVSVAAASVVAKVIRDRQIEKIKKEVGVDFGSGYMSDPKTQVFLKEYAEKFPQLFRRSWKSYQRVKEEKFQKKLGDF